MSRSRLALLASACAVGIALALSTAPAPPACAQTAEPATRVVAKTAEPHISWTKRHGYYLCKVDGRKLKGLRTVKGKTLYFDKKGRQRTGWQKVGGSYRFFKIANKGAGHLVASKTVNGIRLDKEGIARYGANGRAELELMVQANRIYQSITKPTQSRRTRLKKCFSWQLHKCGETLYRQFHARSGWHRAYARDILFKRKGSCSSHAAAFAYFANAAGCKNVLIVGSGGHSWAEVDGKVYDPEWARGNGWRYFAFPMSQSGRAGAPAYRSNRRHIVKLAPRSRAWDKKSRILNREKSSKSTRSGLVKTKSGLCFYMKGKKLTSTWKTIKGRVYYFDGKGRAVSAGSHRIKRGKVRTWWVFDTGARLCTGKRARVVKVAGTRYRVTKAGKAKPGWSDGGTKRFLETGELATGIRLIGGKLWAFSDAGTYDKPLTAQLQANATQRGNASTLLALLGAPLSRTSMGDSCFILGGSDYAYLYAHVRLTTTIAEDGIEYLISCEERS